MQYIEDVDPQIPNSCSTIVFSDPDQCFSLLHTDVLTSSQREGSRSVWSLKENEGREDSYTKVFNTL